MFQTFQLLDALTVQENIALPLWRLRGNRRTAEARAGELAEELGIGHRLKQRPHQLSVGEMQRAAVARALACDPMVILADEPTASLRRRSRPPHHLGPQGHRAARADGLVATTTARSSPAQSRVLKLDRGNLVHDTASPARDHSRYPGESLVVPCTELSPSGTFDMNLYNLGRGAVRWLRYGSHAVQSLRAHLDDPHFARLSTATSVLCRSRRYEPAGPAPLI